MRGLKTTVLLALFALTASAAHAADGFDAVKKSGKLRVAVDATYPPMESEGVDGKPTGFDVDFANELANKLGVKTEFVVMNWDGILAGLTSGRYDVIISSMNITPERAKQVDFVEYIRMSQLFVTKAGKEVKSESELAGKVIAVQADTTSHQFADALKKKGVAIKEVKAFKGMTDAFAAVKSNQAEVIITDEPVGRYYARRDKVFVISGRAMAPEPVGIAIRKSDANLKAAIAKAVEAMKADGTMKKISQNWFGAELGT